MRLTFINFLLKVHISCVGKKCEIDFVSFLFLTFVANWLKAIVGGTHHVLDKALYLFGNTKSKGNACICYSHLATKEPGGIFVNKRF